jgi:hypothetical protein
LQVFASDDSQQLTVERAGKEEDLLIFRCLIRMKLTLLASKPAAQLKCVSFDHC